MVNLFFSQNFPVTEWRRSIQTTNSSFTKKNPTPLVQNREWKWEIHSRFNSVMLSDYLPWMNSIEQSFPWKAKPTIVDILIPLLRLPLFHSYSLPFQKEVTKPIRGKEKRTRSPHFPRTKQSPSLVAQLIKEKKKDEKPSNSLWANTYRSKRLKCTLRPLTERSPLRMHSLSPVPRTITSYSSSIVMDRFQIPRLKNLQKMMSPGEKKFKTDKPQRWEIRFRCDVEQVHSGNQREWCSFRWTLLTLLSSRASNGLVYKRPRAYRFAMGARGESKGTKQRAVGCRSPRMTSAPMDPAFSLFFFPR